MSQLDCLLLCLVRRVERHTRKVVDGQNLGSLSIAMRSLSQQTQTGQKGLEQKKLARDYAQPELLASVALAKS